MIKKHLNIKQINFVPEKLIISMVSNALSEDIGDNDITSLTIDNEKKVKARIINNENMVLCGQKWVDTVFYQLDKSIKINWFFNDGDFIKKNNIICKIYGNSRSILSGERSALNFLQTLSAVSTTTNLYVKKIQEFNTDILDTRKTIPGMRLAQKYAVRCGGGNNHRIGLFDAFLIKENHIESSGGSIKKIVKRARLINPNRMIEVEVENFEDINSALEAQVDIIMLDNFSISDMRKAVNQVQGLTKIEVSGNVSLDTVYEVAETGVDFISIGSLTKNIRAIDLSMRIY